MATSRRPRHFTPGRRKWTLGRRLSLGVPVCCPGQGKGVRSKGHVAVGSVPGESGLLPVLCLISWLLLKLAVHLQEGAADLMRLPQGGLGKGGPFPQFHCQPPNSLSEELRSWLFCFS